MITRGHVDPVGSGPDFFVLYLLTITMRMGQELCKWGDFPGSLQWMKAFAETFAKYFPKTLARDSARAFPETFARYFAKTLAREAFPKVILPGILAGILPGTLQSIFQRFCKECFQGLLPGPLPRHLPALLPGILQETCQGLC